MGAVVWLDAGDRFGKLVVKERTRALHVPVVCDCGASKTVRKYALCSGATRSCGCLHGEKFAYRRHGMTGSPEHEFWSNIRARCYNKSNSGYEHYGARGIRVCDRWLEERGLENFIEDMGPRPPGMSIDRIDTNGNYEPSNCRWATDIQQARNRASVKLTELDALLIHRALRAGVGRTEIASAFGVSKSSIHMIARGKIWKEESLPDVSAPSDVAKLWDATVYAYDESKRSRPTGARNGANTHPEKKLIGSAHPASKLTKEKVAEMHEKHARGISGGVLAAEYGIAQSVAYRILSGETWKHVYARSHATAA